jgi:hypothetical protein
MLGVRSARLTFESPTIPVRVTLFPMVHVGQSEFYSATYADAQTHDVIFTEGVRSPVTIRVTRSYRWLVGSRAMVGLIVQPRFPATDTGARIVHADLTGDEFEVEWRAVPLWLRAAATVLAPVIGLQRRWLYSKAKLAKGMSFEDQPSLAELLAVSPETGALTQAILHARDNRLIECLRAELDASAPAQSSLAIIYGAGHMRAVVRELMNERDYSVSSAEWRTIFTLD